MSVPHGKHAELSKVMPIPRETLQDRVYRQITELILNGAVMPGELVTIQGLADAFGTSAMPVREALKRFTASNVLTIVSGRSIGVPPLSADRLTDLRRVRREVEPLAASWAMEHVTPSVIAALEEQLHIMDRAIQDGQVKIYLQGNHAFHFGIYRQSNSPTLTTFIETLWLQISPYFHLLGDYRVANEEHQAILAALKEGKRDELVAGIQSDIDMAYQTLVKAIPE